MEAGAVDRRRVAAIAREHLSPEDAERWLALLRPAALLVPAGPGDTLVARLGGQPLLPPTMSWPTWEGQGPLAFIGEIDLAALAGLGLDLDIVLPKEGLLSLFYWDGSIDQGVNPVGTWDRETLNGVRALHLTQPRDQLEPREGPAEVWKYRERLLTATQMVTVPGSESQALHAAFGLGDDPDGTPWWQHPVVGDAFERALWERHTGPRHQIGGWAAPVQGPVEGEVAQVALPDGADRTALAAEAPNWLLLVQIDSDDDMMWGDAGTLYWLARKDALAVGDLSNVLFTWQCG